ncbi:MAG: hypothetical protein GX877_01535 [Bacteroidales bacterium]|nr:hypothetical protein [Bacteroidales bacterium]
MKTHHILILSLAFVIGLSGTMHAQNHSIIVDLSETGATTPKPRSTTPGFSLSSVKQEISANFKEVPFVEVDLGKKEVCVRYKTKDKEAYGEMEIVNADGTFRFRTRINTGRTTNMYYLKDMKEPGIYCITIRVSGKSYTGFFMY